MIDDADDYPRSPNLDIIHSMLGIMSAKPMKQA